MARRIKPAITHGKALVQCCQQRARNLAAFLAFLFYQAQSKWTVISYLLEDNSSSSSFSSFRTMPCISSSMPVLLSCPIFAPTFGQRKAVQSDLEMSFHSSILCDFCKPVIVHPVYTDSSCSSPDSGPSYDILDLADIADVLVANSMLQSIAP